MTDHYCSVEQLKEAGQNIPNGEELTFDEQTLKAMWVSEESMKSMSAGGKKFIYGCFAILILIALKLTWKFVFLALVR